MKNMKLKLMIAVVGLVAYSHAQDSEWLGGIGQYGEATNWNFGYVPDTGFADTAIISSGTAIYDAWVLGDFWVTPPNKLVLDGGTLEQTSTHWMRTYNGGYLEISNGGSLRTGANKLIMTDGGSNTVDGAGSSILALGPVLMAVESGSSLSVTGGATCDFTRPVLSLWQGGTLNISDNSVVNAKNIESYGGTPGRVNLYDSGLLYLTGTNAGVIGVDPGHFVNFDSGHTGYVKIRGIDQAELEFMITDSKFGINGAVNTNAVSYEYTAISNVVHIGLVTPPVPDPYVPGLWLGGDGEWLDTSKWSGDVYPYIDGTDDVAISSPTNIIITYKPGTDLVFNYGSDLLLDGVTLYQESSSWAAIKGGSTLNIENGGAWIFESAHVILDGEETGEAIHTVDNGTFSVREVEVNDQQVLILTNGATATVTVHAAIQDGARIDVMDATLNLGEVALNFGAAAVSNSHSFINVHDEALVNLDAGFYEEGFKTNVIQKTGDSMVNFSSTNTIGEVFIDNISLADVEALIGQSKFGIGGTINTTVADYVIVAAGAGQRVRVMPTTMPVGPISVEYVSGDLLILWNSFTGQDYEVQEKTDLTMPAWGTVTNVAGIGGVMSVTVPADNTNSFYQVISQ